MGGQNELWVQHLFSRPHPRPSQSGAGALAVAYNMSSESLHSRSVDAIRSAASARWAEKTAKRADAEAARREADAAREEHALFLAGSHQRVASVRERKERQVRGWGEWVV